MAFGEPHYGLSLICASLLAVLASMGWFVGWSWWLLPIMGLGILVGAAFLVAINVLGIIGRAMSVMQKVSNKLFLNEPRYVLGCLGFYTNPVIGKRLIQVGTLLSGMGCIAAFVGGISPGSSSPGGQALFLIVSAWVLMLGLMRLFWTGVMWIFSQIYEFIASSIPSLSSTMHFLCRVYWVFIEVFLSTAFLGMLGAAILVGFGVFSLV